MTSKPPANDPECDVAARTTRIVLQHHAQLLRHARRFVDARDAHDLVQETFLRFAARPGAVDETAALPYLLRIVSNLGIDHLRRNQRRNTAEGVFIDKKLKNTPPPLSEVVVSTWLDQLPERQADVVRERLIEGHSFADIARRFGLSEGTIKTHFRRGIEHLRILLATESAGRRHEP